MTKVQQAEYEAEQARQDLHRTLEALSDRLSFQNLLSQASGYINTEGGRQFAYNLSDQVKSNPVPLLLMGIGATWLMMGGRGGSDISGPDGDWRERAEKMGSRAGERASEWGARAEKMGSRAAERASEWGSHASSRGQQAREVIGSKAEDVANRGQEFYRTIAENYDRQPLVFGAVAFALGSAMSAIFAPTRFEHEHFGQVGAEARDRAMDAAQRGMEAAKPAVSAAYEAGKREVKEEAETDTTPGSRPTGGPVTGTRSS